jgi:hypothetical protein
MRVWFGYPPDTFMEGSSNTVVFFIFWVFLVLLGLELRAHTYQAGALQLEPLCQFML